MEGLRRWIYRHDQTAEYRMPAMADGVQEQLQPAQRLSPAGPAAKGHCRIGLGVRHAGHEQANAIHFFTVVDLEGIHDAPLEKNGNAVGKHQGFRNIAGD